MIFPLHQRDRSAALASKSALYLDLVCFFVSFLDYLFIVYPFICVHTVLSPASRVTNRRKRSWQMRQRQQEMTFWRARACTCVNQLWLNVWKEWQQLFRPTQLTGLLLMCSRCRDPVPPLQLSERETETHAEY